MFGGHFYHSTLRKTVAIFGTMFNNISVVRKNAAGGIINQIKVPLAYGPKEKFLSRIDQDADKASMAIKLPRMSFEITGLEYDINKKLNKRNKVTEVNSSDGSKLNKIDTQTPYNISIQLNIMAKSQDDGLQILEQILPCFTPEYTVSVKPVDTFTSFKQDVPIILQSTTMADEYEGDYLSRRVLTYSLEFQMKMTFYGPTASQAVIKEIDIDFFDKTQTSLFYEGINLEVDPSTADKGDTEVSASTTPGTGQYRVLQTIDFLSQPDQFTLTCGVPTGTFTVGEIITGQTSGTTGTVVSAVNIVDPGDGSIDGITIVINDSSAYFAPESVVGNTSGASATIASFV